MTAFGFASKKASAFEGDYSTVEGSDNISETKLVYPFLADSLENSFFFADTSDSLAADSLLADSLKIDSLAIDSTARLKHFKFRREDRSYIRFTEKRPSPFFVQPSAQTVQRTAKLDSTGQYVILKETVAGKTVRPPIRVPLEEYIRLKMDDLDRDIWEELGYKYELKSDTKDLGELLSDITNIQIPLPSSSFLSIFGPPEINLKINGAVDIYGAMRSETTEGLSASRLGNTRNEPDFKQQVQINVRGTIGDKLDINADWNTERTFEYENQLKIVYTGYEDEIVQRVEAGNVSLQTSPLVGGSEALFGVKANFQMGPFTLTALASQKKGEVEEVSVTGGSSSQEFKVRAYQYSENHFFVDEIFATNENLQNNFGATTPQTSPYRVTDIEVYKTAQGTQNTAEEIRGNAFYELPANVSYDDLRDISATAVTGSNLINARFTLLIRDTDYILDENAGIITFRNMPQETDGIAIAYKLQTPQGEETYGEFQRETEGTGENFVYVFKLLKPANRLEPTYPTWKLQLRNIYPINARDVNKENFKLDLAYEISGQDPVTQIENIKLLEAFQLDQLNQSGDQNPDGAFDFRTGQTIFPSTGEIIFPFLEPFGKDIPEGLDEFKYSALYNETKTQAQRETSQDKWLITGEYSASVVSTFSIGFNVVENSVKVLLNGNELREGTDYVVDYNIGQVTVRNEAALVPNANLRITYEKNDLFALASKTLVGFRGLYEYDRNTRLGFSFLNLNQQTLSDKVRIGEEPMSNTIYGVDFQTSSELPFLTRALDNVISTSSMSSLAFKGEYAYINPTPNTKKSGITADGGKSIAYVDDFEASKRIIPISISFTNWKDISVPDNMPYVPAGMTKPSLMSYKAKSFWFNVTPSYILVNDIWGDRRKVARDNQQVTVLEMVYRPEAKGTYNLDPQLEDPRRNWGGMMTGLSSAASNLIDENIEFIEFWMYVADGTPQDTMYIDLGQVSEDIRPNSEFDREDLNENDIEEPGEDTGIDGLFDEQEPGYNASTNPDPAGDNFALDNSRINIIPVDIEAYSRVNGTEGNIEFRNAGIKTPDNEDLNRNLTLDAVNAYFRYAVPLDTTANNPFRTGPGPKGKWVQIRVPLKDYISTVGDANLTLVNAVRFWFTGIDHQVHVKFAEMNLVGNQWEKVLTEDVTIEDTVLTVGTVNFEDNPDYNSPVGRERDRTNPNEEILKNEQSLQLLVNELAGGEIREIKKVIRPIDLFNYKEMKMFIHGPADESMPSSVAYWNGPDDYGAEIYFRFGSDTNNYYEYRQPVRSGWNNMEIIFSELTAIKQVRDSAQAVYRVPVPGRENEGHSYAILGNPSLTSVGVFIIGIENPVLSEEDDVLLDEHLSGEIWVNELRVLDAEDSEGWAYSFSTSMALADFITVNANMSRTSPHFHSLGERFGSRVEKLSWGTAFDVDILKLIPVNLSGSNLRLNYSHTESVSKPLYLPGTDVLVEEAAEATLRDTSTTTEYDAAFRANEIRSTSQTINVSDSWSLANISIKIPTNAWYIRDIINKLSFGFNYSENFSRNPTILTNNSWVWNANARYSHNFSNDYFFYPANIPLLGKVIELFADYRNVKLFYTPRSVSSGVSARRNYSYSKNRLSANQRTTNVSETKANIQRDFTTSRNFGFTWKFSEGGVINPSLNYSADFNATLAYLLTDRMGDDLLQDRTESEIWSDIFNGAFFGRDVNFRQGFDFKTSPKLPTLWDINRYFTINASYASNFQWQNNLAQEEAGRSGGFNQTITAGLNLRLKSLMDPLFEGGKAPNAPKGNNRGERERDQRGRGRGVVSDRTEEPENGEAPSDTTAVEEDEEGGSIFSPVLTGLNYMKAGLRYILFDYEQISINYRQNNNFSGSGLAGEGTGFGNFWGIRQRWREGPSRAFQMGLSYDIGPRVKGYNLSDNFTSKNTVDLKTSRPLWEGASVDLSWQLSWGKNRTTQFTINPETNEVEMRTFNLTGSETLDRSFLTMPPILFLSMFGNGLKKVSELYDPEAPNRLQNLSDAFVEGFETLPLISKIPLLKDVARYVPRPNWRITWNGLEKISFFKGIAKRVSLNHSYSSNYTEGWKISNDGRDIQKQIISWGFSPLLGLNVTFEDLWEGNFTGSIKYGTKASYNLSSVNESITESASSDLGFTASFSKAGFELPLFGVSLKNDIEMSLSYTMSENLTKIFDMNDFNEEGKPQDGSVRTVLEPRVKYVMSSKVNITLFYKRTDVQPAEGAARIPPTTTNEAGLEVHISIN